MRKKSSKGFTLLEILIVLVILAVLAGLAIPAYSTAVEKQRKQEAISNLGAVRSSQLRYYSAFNTYSGSFANLDFDPTNTAIGPAQNRHFTYTITSPSATTFTATATRDTAVNCNGCTAYTVTINQAGTISSNF